MDVKDYLKYSTRWLCFTTFVTAFGSSLLLGYNIGVLNSPTQLIIAFYNETYTARIGQSPSEGLLGLLWAVTVSVFVGAGMVGAFFTGIVADYFGRQRGLLFNHTFMFVGVLFEGLAKPCAAPELLIIGRAVVGISCGLTVGLASLYLTEIAPKQIRGAVGSCHQLAVTLGILLAQVLGLRQGLGTLDGWPVLCVLSVAPAVLSVVALPFCPESPRYLLIKCGNEAKATLSLTKLRQYDDVRGEIEEMAREAKEEQTTGVTFSVTKLVQIKELRMPLLVAVVLQVAQQWSGINAIFFYSESIFRRAGLQSVHIPYAIVGTGIVNVVTTIFSVHLVERLGRRLLLIGPMALMALSTVVITISLNLQMRYSWMAYISIACIVLFIVGFASGLGSIPPIVCAELFRQEPRSAAMAVAQGVNWMCNFILALTFKFIQSVLGAYTFLVFTVVLLVCIIFIVFFVPETKNRTFDDIARDLALGTVVRSASRFSTTVLLSENSVEASSPPVPTVSAETPMANQNHWNHGFYMPDGHGHVGMDGPVMETGT